MQASPHTNLASQSATNPLLPCLKESSSKRLSMEVSALTHPSSIPGLRGPSALLRLQSDERLIALTRRGNHAAFETLCARYQSRLHSFCRHMLGSREDAEDVLQEVFAAAFNAVLADERDINVRPWLYRIARNRSLNHLRRASATGVDSMDIHYAENGISTSDKVLRRESFQELIADVHELPETQRTALLLREIDALSYEQIAHAMETTVPSVKSLLVRARISLAEAAESRKLNCEEVRLELGEAAEGLTKLSTPARRHVRSCERCATFKKHLKANNHALAIIMPVAPMLLVKKLLLAKLGTTASAGGAHVASGAGAVGATATATVGAGAAASGGAGFAGGLVTAGAGAIATKAVAGLAAAAIVTAGAVAAGNAVKPHRRHHPASLATASVPAASYASEPVVIHQVAQPVSAGAPPAPVAKLALVKHHAAAHKTPANTTPPAPPTTTVAVAVPAKPVDPDQPVQVTEVTTETTALPTSATATPTTPVTPPPTGTSTTTTTSTSSSSTPTSPPPATPTEETTGSGEPVVGKAPEVPIVTGQEPQGSSPSSGSGEPGASGANTEVPPADGSTAGQSTTPEVLTAP
jgi:RNA polymerase sigma factor (sigma-70 family)